MYKSSLPITISLHRMAVPLLPQSWQSAKLFLQSSELGLPQPLPRTDEKENKIFLIYQEIQNGAVAKLYMTNVLLIYGEIFAHFLIY